MHDFDIWVSNIGPPLPDVVNDSYKLCHHRSGITGAGTTDVLSCTNLSRGQFVYVSINSTAGQEVLTICEFEVFQRGKSLVESKYILTRRALRERRTPPRPSHILNNKDKLDKNKF